MIGPVAEQLERELGFNDTQIGSLNAIYSLPNIFLVLIGGLIVDRFGAARVTLWTTAICLAGAALTAWQGDSAGYTPMIVFFAVLAMGAFFFSVALWRRETGPHSHGLELPGALRPALVRERV